MTSTQTDSDIEKNRLLWRSRQGTRELELLLFRYIDRNYEKLSKQTRQTLHQLVEQDFDSLNQWLLGGIEPDNRQIKKLIDAILKADLTNHADST